MSKLGYAGLVLVLAILAPSVLGSGFVHLSNNAAPLTFLPEFHLVNGSSMILSSVPLGHSQSVSDQLNDVVDCVEVSFLMNPDNIYWNQNVRIWCTMGSPSNFCGPDCYWEIDWNGFSVGPSATAPKQFVIGWNNGYN